MTHTYAPGDKVKIISMEEVMMYPQNHVGWRSIGNVFWMEEMNFLAGTMRVINGGGRMCYTMVGMDYSFSPEMIAGPAEAPQEPDREKYAERLERFVLAVATSWTWKDTPEDIVLTAKRLLAAFDEEVKKYQP